jgi:hypothetical protein
MSCEVIREPHPLAESFYLRKTNRMQLKFPITPFLRDTHVVMMPVPRENLYCTLALVMDLRKESRVSALHAFLEFIIDDLPSETSDIQLPRSPRRRPFQGPTNGPKLPAISGFG